MSRRNLTVSQRPYGSVTDHNITSHNGIRLRVVLFDLGGVFVGSVEIIERSSYPGRMPTLVYDRILLNTAVVTVYRRILTEYTWLSITIVFLRVVYGGIRPFPDTSEVCFQNIIAHDRRAVRQEKVVYDPKRLVTLSVMDHIQT